MIPREAALAAIGLLPAQREPLIGSFVGDYLITGRLGKGGFGRVLLGLQRPLYRLKAAVKLLEFEGHDARTTAKVFEKFEVEAGVLAVLQHPNIVRLLHYGEFQGRAFMAMEFIPGARTLQSEIGQMGLDHRSLDAAVIRHILTQILNGLEAAHAQAIIHRDIKPENIMLQDVVGDPWHVKIVDFGLAKVVAESHETSLVLGTVHYMAPEQIEAKNLGAWTDLYAVGVITFELLTGRRPFAGKDTQDILRQKLSATHDVFARVMDLALPAPVLVFLRKALARHPEERFRTTKEMRAALGSVFDALASTATEFSRDLSGLMDSEEVARFKQERASLDRERASLDELREMLEVERRALQSEIVRISSQRLGIPGEVEFTAIGHTQALGVSPVAGTVHLGTAPTTALSTHDFQTGVPPLAVAPRPHRRSWLWLVALLCLASGSVAAYIATRASSAAGSAVATVVATVDVSASRAAATVDVSAGSADVSASRAAGSADVSASRAAGSADSIALSVSTPAPVLEPAPTTASAPRSSKRTTLEITSEPTEASVYVDGQLVGTTPFTLETHLGAKHKIELEAAGRPREVRELVVVAEASKVEVPLPVVETPPPVPSRPRPRPNTRPTEPAPTRLGMQPVYVDDP